jgi:DNA invertase Pin-like site-specific DNA recombinase
LLDLGGQAVDTSSAMGRFFLTVMAGAAEMERNQTRERTAAAMRFKKARGEWLGGRWTPFGTRLDTDGVHLASDAAAGNVVAMARQWRGEGLTFREISERLKAAGYLSRTGRPFHPQQIARMVA